MVDKEIVERIKRIVVKDSPEMEGVEPEIREIKSDEPVAPKRTMEKLGLPEVKTKKGYRFSFRKKVIAEDGAEIPIVVHVTTDEKGNIIRYTGN